MPGETLFNISGEWHSIQKQEAYLDISTRYTLLASRLLAQVSLDVKITIKISTKLTLQGCAKNQKETKSL